MVRGEEVLIGVQIALQKCTVNACPKSPAEEQGILTGETTLTKGKICEDGILESKGMENPLKLKRIHHIEFWVGNARQAAYFYRKGFGFSQTAYKGLETGERRVTSYALTQGRINFLFTTPLGANQPGSEHIRDHGDGVWDVALHVEDADRAFEEAMRRGAQVAEEPHNETDRYGTIRRAAVH